MDFFKYINCCNFREKRRYIKIIIYPYKNLLSLKFEFLFFEKEFVALYTRINIIIYPYINHSRVYIAWSLFS